MKRTSTLLLLPLVAACAATTAKPTALFESAWSPPAGQSCTESSRPESLPPVESVLDVTALRAHLAEQGTGLPPALFSVSFDSTGTVRSVRVVEPRGGGGEVDRLREAVERSVRPQRAGRGWGVLLRVEPGAPSFRLGRFEECRPQLQNRREVARVLERGMSEAAKSRIARWPTRPVVMRLHIDTAGTVIAVQPQTFTQIRSLDSLAINVSREMRFDPALLNREPVAVWIQMPVQFAVQPTASDSTSFPSRSRPRE
jgi:hypothetical protein